MDECRITTFDCASLAKRWKVPESWVRDQLRSRAADPIPHVRFGRYVRFEWQHPDLIEWLKRRRTHYHDKTDVNEPLDHQPVKWTERPSLGTSLRSR